LLDPLMAALRKRAVAGEVMVALHVGRIDQLLARRERPVEWNKVWRHWVDFTGLQGALSPFRVSPSWRFRAPESTTDPNARRQQSQSSAPVNYRHRYDGLVAR
jgi:hypothetical protein